MVGAMELPIQNHLEGRKAMFTILTFLPLVKDLLAQWQMGSHFDAQIIALPITPGGKPPALTPTSEFYLTYYLVSSPPWDQNSVPNLHLSGGDPSGQL